MRALVPGFDETALGDLADLRVAVAWTELADPLVAARVSEAAARFTHAERVDFPFPSPDENLLFAREIADVHRALFPEHADEYGDNVRPKIERCFEVTDGEAAAGARLRAEYREQCAELLDGYDLLLTPTTMMVAMPTEVYEPDVRRSGIRLTYPFDVLGWPAIALPCGPAEDGLPASVQLVARQGADGLVLAAATRLASLI
jgi:aspartyl-tRNA(Asn)/glutamyl-tRNA(Gln) amidotransferase subunit A